MDSSATEGKKDTQDMYHMPECQVPVYSQPMT